MTKKILVLIFKMGQDFLERQYRYFRREQFSAHQWSIQESKIDPLILGGGGGGGSGWVFSKKYILKNSYFIISMFVKITEELSNLSDTLKISYKVNANQP